MGSLNNGQHINQDKLSTKHLGHVIQVTNYDTDTVVDSHRPTLTEE